MLRITNLEEDLNGQGHHANPSESKQYILDSGAHPTHVAKQTPNMRPTKPSRTRNANGSMSIVTHTGQILLQTKTPKNLKIPAIHVPDIKKNLLSVHDLTRYRHFTFTPTQATLHRPI